MGSSVSHHHSHESIRSYQHGSDYIPAFNATESITDIVDRNASLTAENSEHDHNNHSHSPSHLPLESRFNSDFYQAGTFTDVDVLFNNDRYAPPTPPPHRP